MKVQFYVTTRYHNGVEICAAEAGEIVELPGPVGSALAARALVFVIEPDPPPPRHVPRSVVKPRPAEYEEYDDGSIRRPPEAPPAPGPPEAPPAPGSDEERRSPLQRAAPGNEPPESPETADTRNDDDEPEG